MLISTHFGLYFQANNDILNEIYFSKTINSKPEGPSEVSCPIKVYIILTDKSKKKNLTSRPSIPSLIKF